MEYAELGNIHVEERLPGVFKNTEVREATHQSLELFKAKNGELPLKYRLAKFIFDRDEQVCTADSPEKLLAWSASDIDLTASILSQITPQELSVVLRSNMIDVPDDNPTLQIKSRQEIDDFLRHREDSKKGIDIPHQSKIWNEFFAKIMVKNAGENGHETLDRTVVQLLKNVTEQKGLFLIRPTFIQDERLRDEIRNFQQDGLAKVPEMNMQIAAVPESFVGFRILPIGEFAREKKTTLGYMCIYNPQTNRFEIRSGSTDQMIYSGIPTGRSINFNDNNTTSLHYEKNGIPINILDITGLDSLTLNTADITYLQHVLQWQLPRIFSFQGEIEQQDWIEQQKSVTHQFVIFPPQSKGDRSINTQYFDFHPYANDKQFEEKAEYWYQKPFDTLTTQEKIVTFF